MPTDLIIVSEYCEKCHVEPDFIVLLEEEGLIEIRRKNKERYILVSQLQELERYSRMYYDLAINVAGIDVIRHLLERMESMRTEISLLKRQQNVYPLGVSEYLEE